MDYVITCCSTVDLTAERLAERNVKWVPFHFHLNGKDYPDDFGNSMSLEEFYRREKAGEKPTTSQVNVDEYIAFWTPFLEKGQDIFHAALSSGISGTYNSACIAAGEIREKYPERKILVLDTLCASAGFGLIVEEFADRRDEGMGIDDLFEYGMKLRGSVNHWFFTSDLTSLIRGGRISVAAGTVANILGICPVMTVNEKGGLEVSQKVRTKKRACQEVVNIMERRAQNGKDYNGRCYISYSNCPEDAECVKAGIEERFPALKDKVQLFRIGTTIGSHTGDATVALFFLGEP